DTDNTALHAAPHWTVADVTPLGLPWPGRKSGRAVAELLLAKGADLHAVNKQGQTPASLAAQRGGRDLLEFLDSRGPDRDCHAVPALGRAEARRKWLARGPRPGAPGEYQYPPLHLAALFGQAGTAEVLLDKGADVNAAGPYGLTPLHLAAVAGDVK